MWKALDLDNGIWIELGSFPTVSDAEQNIEKLKQSDSRVFLFWDGPISSDINEQNKLADEISKANHGRILMTTIGLKPGEKEVGISSCSGDCFCVIANGSRNCQTRYCNSSGWCWWVSCGSSC